MIGRFKIVLFVAIIAALGLIAQPRLGFAQCELPKQPPVASKAAIIAQTGAVTGMTTAIIAAVETTTTLARAAIVSGMEVGWLTLRERLNQYWLDQQEALKGQAGTIKPDNWVH